MQRWGFFNIFILVLTNLIFAVGCSPVPFEANATESSIETNDDDTGEAIQPINLNDINLKAQQVIATNCASCHNPTTAAGGIVDLTDKAFLLQEGLVVAGDSLNSELLKVIEEGRMPANGEVLSPEDIESLQDWTDFAFEPQDTGVAAIDFSHIATIYENQCIRCHSITGGISGDFNFANATSDAADFAGVITSLTPGAPYESRSFLRALDGTMPPAPEEPVTNRDLAKIYNWIYFGANQAP